jgi:hypothetical protein
VLAPAPEQLLEGLPVVQEPGVGWAALRDIDFIGEMAMVLGLALVLAAVIAYHPTLRSRASTLAEIEQPKTFMMYSMIGALIAIVVKVQPSMALVVFGIGGLMRFRTDVGQAKDTGRVILVTVVGLSCGLELYVVALLATALAADLRAREPLGRELARAGAREGHHAALERGLRRGAARARLYDPRRREAREEG